MEHIRKADLLGKPTIISVVPSLDTPVCQVQTKTFNKRLAALGDKINALTVSLDLPFAMNRFCGAEDIKGMRNGSDYMDRASAATSACSSTSSRSSPARCSCSTPRASCSTRRS